MKSWTTGKLLRNYEYILPSVDANVIVYSISGKFLRGLSPTKTLKSLHIIIFDTEGSVKSKESLERIKFAQQTKFKHPRHQAVQLIT